MASSLISSSLHIDFDSVFGIDDVGLVQMFELFITTGLKEFLGCPAVFYKSALTEFFENGSVRDVMVVSTIVGTTVEISEEIFAAMFELSTEEQVSISCHKREMKIEYRLLSDILANTIYVKAGSFYAVTRERFLLMTVITFDVKVNWSRLLFDVLKDMVTTGSRQAKGYAVQICGLLKNVQGLELGESKEFPTPRILTEKQFIGNPGSTAGRGFNPAGGAPGGLTDTDEEIDPVDAATEFETGVREHPMHIDEEMVAAIRSELLDFRAKAEENYLTLSTQLGELVDYIRGGHAKKGEGSSSRPQPPPDDQDKYTGGDGGNTCGDNVRTTDIVDRFSGSMSRESQIRGRSGGRRSSGSYVSSSCNSDVDQRLCNQTMAFNSAVGYLFSVVGYSAVESVVGIKSVIGWISAVGYSDARYFSQNDIQTMGYARIQVLI
ncbi:hypothetical protein F511_38645 [Dorcoceras hygrometricum]|uniref:Uncharacterized protein n=1 Tax=Dorcoceras hygrometricum TaxID=472368 RepID=A0A2Z7BIP2_9LAMI|nr:hypothetical protein F511_38645 [Dorcoceras hygrometricum]